MPPLEGTLDLGCGVGDLAAEFVVRGARVLGFDASEELIEEARGRNLQTAEFHVRDLRERIDLDVQADGIWCAFTAAYLPDLSEALRRWSRCLKPRRRASAAVVLHHLAAEWRA